MSTNGQLVFTDVDKITFKGVGNASNAVVDTLTGKIGVGVDSPDANLHVLGNSYVSTNLELGGTLIMGTVNVEAQHSLEAVTATGNITPLTIEFTNPTTSLVASGNVVVTGNVTADYFVGDGSNITGISSNLDQIVNIGNVTSNTVQFSNAITSLTAASNVVVTGNVTAGSFLGDGSELTALNAANIASGTLDAARVPTLNQSTTGSAATLTTPRTIGGVNFDGSAAITPTTFGGATFSGDVTVDTDTFHVDTTNDRVGVGTASPGQKLSIYTGSTNTAALSFDRSSSGNYRTDIYQDSYGADFRVGYGSYTPATVLYLKRMSDGAKRVVIKDRLGIGKDDPLTDLHIKQSGLANHNGNGQSGIRFERGDNTDNWNIGVDSSTNFNFMYNNSSMGYLGQSDVSIISFTGQHRNIIRGITPEGINELQGLIVSANTNKYIKINNGVETGSNAITINESIPVVSLSNVVTDKTCFGVISASEDPEERSDAYGNFVTPFEKEKGDTRVFINSVGEGAIWVVNTNGSLESGDYITTSNVAGYGQKQDSEFLANYTVAKITMDCDFDPVTQPVQIIKKGEDEENVLDEHNQIQWEDHPTETEKAYKIRYLDASGVETDEANAVHTAAFVGCTYHCG